MTVAIRLVERRPTVCRLPRADAAALLADWPHVVQLAPTRDRGCYKLTARGWAGSFATPGLAWEVVPKLGWPAVRHLAGGALAGAADESPTSTAVRSLLADRLAVLMGERATAGLVRGYAERPEHSALVRGRIDLAATARGQIGGRVGQSQLVDEFTADQPWNGWPIQVAVGLLGGPLDPAVRARLAVAVGGFAGGRPCPAPVAPAWSDDLRLAAYAPLHGWCRVTAGALAGGGVLLPLERLFESHVSRLLSAPHRGRAAVAQRPLALRGPSGVVELRPDLTVLTRSGKPVAVWDAKWKRPAAPEPADVHQVLGYAAALGVTAAGLVLPGRRFAHARYVAPSGVAVTVATCRLLGNPAAVTRAAKRLRRLVLGGR